MVTTAAGKQRNYLGKRMGWDATTRVHLSWVDTAEGVPRALYPRPNLFSLAIDGAANSDLAAAIIALMRSPQYTDATVDMMYERYLKIPVDLLLGERVHVLP